MRWGGFLSWCQAPHYLISGRASCPEPKFRMLAVRKPSWMGPISLDGRIGPGWLRSPSAPRARGKRLLPPARGLGSVGLCLHGCALRNEPCGEIAPQRDEDPAGQGDGGDPSAAATRVGDIVAEPLAQRAVGLMLQPQPRQLDQRVAGARIACLADALVEVDVPALPRAGTESAITGDLAAIGELLV